MTRRAVVATAVVLAGAMLLTGCIRIPSGGDVHSSTIQASQESFNLFPLAEDPAPGATPEAILQGFIRAGRGPQDQYSVARKFLSTEFANTWAPGAGVIITSSAITPEHVDEDTVRLSLSVSAELDATGRYTSAPEGSTRTLEYEFVQEDGEWRISAAPDGTVLPPSSFDRIFEPVHLYYFSPGFEYLVPELRWFLATPRTIPTSIANELIAARSEYVAAGVLLSAFPSGTEVQGNVRVEDGRASVELGPSFLSEPPLSQWRMLQQLTWSLRSLRDVHSVEPTASSGLPIDIPSFEAPDRLLTVDPAPVGLRDGAFGRLTVEEVRPIEGLSAAVAEVAPRAAAIGRHGDGVAVLTADGVSLVTAEQTTLLDDRPGLVAPSLDPWGYVWSVPAGDPAALIAVDAEGSRHAVPISFDGRVVSVDVSRDGTRLLVALETSTGPRVFVAGIVRDSDLAPTELVAPMMVPTGPGEAIDATWIDGETVAVLTRTSTASAVTAAMLGGRSVSLGAILGGEQIVGGSVSEGTRGVYVRTEEGAVYRPSANGDWTRTSVGAEFLATQQ